MARADSEKRGRILAAAVEVFAGHGWKGTTTRMLGHNARVNSALIYYYFENKHELFLSALRFVLKGFLEHMRAERREFGGARERLEFLVNGVFDYYSAHPGRMRLISRPDGPDPDVGPARPGPCAARGADRRNGAG